MAARSVFWKEVTEMGFLDKLFGGGEQYPPLEPGSEPAEKLDHFTGELESLADSMRDPMYAVPKDDELFVFVGKPPKAFGVFRCTEDGQENLVEIMREHKAGMAKMQAVSDQARKAYVEYEEAPRFTHEIGKRKVTVIDSEPLAEKLDEVFEAARA